MSENPEDVWKLHVRAAIGDLIAALGSMYATTQLDHLVEASANLKKALEAFPDEH